MHTLLHFNRTIETCTHNKTLSPRILFKDSTFSQRVDPNVYIPQEIKFRTIYKHVTTRGGFGVQTSARRWIWTDTSRGRALGFVQRDRESQLCLYTADKWAGPRSHAHTPIGSSPTVLIIALRRRRLVRLKNKTV